MKQELKISNETLSQPKVLILFVHGFLGSENSFCSFPLDLVKTIRSLYKLQNIEARVFPFFETKGTAEKAINSLHNWLLLNASMPEYESVILVAHSMGGLIAVDALRKLLPAKSGQAELESKQKRLSIAIADVEYNDLLKNETLEKGDGKCVEEVPLEPEQPGWFSGLWSRTSTDKDVQPNLETASKTQSTILVTEGGLESFPVEASEEFVPKVTQTRTNDSTVNIGAIIAFDSPFYGLSSSVFTRGAGDYSADIISEYVPSNHKEKVHSTLKYTTSVTANAVESIPALASSTVEAIPQATSTAVSTVLLPITDPKKAASIMLYPVSQIPFAVSTAASIASSYFAKGQGKAESNVRPSGFNEDVEVTNSESMRNKLVIEDGKLKMTRKESTLGSPLMLSEKFESQNSLKDHSITKNDRDAATSSVKPVKGDDLIDLDVKPKSAELLPIPKDNDWSSLIGLGLKTAVLATGAYYSGGLLIAGGVLASGFAQKYGFEHAEIARQHLQFLYPIWGETQKASEERMEVVVDEMRGGKFIFKTYYIEIPREEGGEPRTFIKLPPPLKSYLFKPVGSDFGNEIGAHMHIFSREQNPGYYWNLIHQTAVDVKNAVEIARDKRF